MTILSAQFGNQAGNTVFLTTSESGVVLITTSGPDNSGGWRAVYTAWLANGGETAAYEVPAAPPDTVEAFAARNGFGNFQLIDLKDMEDKLRAASIEIPPKAAAVRAWVDSVRLAFATAQTPANAPHSYEEVLAEVLPILNP